MHWLLLALLLTGGPVGDELSWLDRYHPVPEGASWTYAVDEGGEQKDQTVRVESNDDDRRVVLHARTGGRSLRYALLRVDGAWCLRSVDGRVPLIGLPVEKRFYPPVPYLRVPPGPGPVHWQWAGSSRGFGDSVTSALFTARFAGPGRDTLEVHARWFDGDEPVAEYTAIYGDGVGLIAQTATDYDKRIVGDGTVAAGPASVPADSPRPELE